MNNMPPCTHENPVYVGGMCWACCQEYDAAHHETEDALYRHQREGIAFLAKRSAAMLCDEMGLGKTRQALCAALELFRQRKIDRVLVLAPAAVRYSWQEEVQKLSQDGQHIIIWGRYYAEDQKVVGQKFAEHINLLPLVVVSYALLPQKRHVEALRKWCEDGKTLLVCDESSFLKNRTAKQTKGSATIARSCVYRWLLTGTPVANSPLDLYGQSLVMSNGSRGPLSQFKSFYHFRARYAVLKLMNMGQVRFQQVVGYQNLPELTKRFAPYVLRREKKDCLDLPEKSYTVREVQLTDATWRIYQELRREALLALPDADVRPEPNAAVRILRLCQLTSGHVGTISPMSNTAPKELEVADYYPPTGLTRDVSSEKLDFITEALLDGELSTERAVICWMRWRRERERLAAKLKDMICTFEIYGGQDANARSNAIQGFQIDGAHRRILLAQPHAGGYGLNLTAASIAVFLSNDFSHVTRIQAEDRCHRIGQKNAVTYVDVVAVGPRFQRTVDHHILECLRAKQDIAAMTCGAWRKVLSDE